MTYVNSASGDSVAGDYPVLYAFKDGDIESIFEQVLDTIAGDFTDEQRAKEVAAALILRDFREELADIEKRILDMTLRAVPFEHLVESFYYAVQETLKTETPIDEQLAELSGSADLYLTVDLLPPAEKSIPIKESVGLTRPQVDLMRSVNTDLSDVAADLQDAIADAASRLVALAKIDHPELDKITKKINDALGQMRAGVGSLIQGNELIKQIAPRPPETTRLPKSRSSKSAKSKSELRARLKASGEEIFRNARSETS